MVADMFSYFQSSGESLAPYTDDEARALLPQSRQAEIAYKQYRAYGLTPAHALDAVLQIWRAIWQ